MCISVEKCLNPNSNMISFIEAYFYIIKIKYNTSVHDSPPACKL